MKYNFDVDNIVLPEDYLDIISKKMAVATKDYVLFHVSKYGGRTSSEYDESNTIAGTVAALSTGRIVFDIQNELGVVAGDESKKYEFYLSGAKLKNYKFRIMLIEHGLGGYPVRIVLEQNIANELDNKDNSGTYTYYFESFDKFKDFVDRVMNTKFLHQLIQSIITETLINEKK